MTSLAVPAFTSVRLSTRPAPVTRYLYEAPAPESDDTRRVTLTYTGEIERGAQGRLEVVVAQINDVLRLRDGWNGECAQPVTTLAALLAVEWLDRVAGSDVPAPHVVALHQGGVQLEWVAGGHAFEVEVGPTGSLGILGVDAAGNVLVDLESAQLEWPAGLADARKFLAWMYSSDERRPVH